MNRLSKLSRSHGFSVSGRFAEAPGGLHFRVARGLPSSFSSGAPVVEPVRAAVSQCGRGGSSGVRPPASRFASARHAGSEKQSGSSTPRALSLTLVQRLVSIGAMACDLAAPVGEPSRPSAKPVVVGLLRFRLARTRRRLPPPARWHVRDLRRDAAHAVRDGGTLSADARPKVEPTQSRARESIPPAVSRRLCHGPS